MFAVIFGLFGLIIGSFLNVLILRGGVRSLAGRSSCMSCKKEILWYDLLPILSWMFLRGKCRFCKSKISAQYLLVELITALLFAVIGASTIPILFKLFALPIIAILIAISVYDLRHTIIPDAWVWTFNALAFSSIFLPMLWSGPRLFDVGVSVLAGISTALPLFLLWLVSRGRWMGLGDAKLALGIGWLLGPFYGMIALFFAFIIGAAVSVFILLPFPYIVRFSKKVALLRQGFEGQGIARLSNASQRITMKSEVPFGPFLVSACLLVWITQMYGIPLPFLWQ
ncbi:MAG: prepilin peptidase [Candidatus Kaiserbacteria bacterium]|nr:prepilin peptidase [Candidatus Kaiserbacteria bacterium]